MIDINLVAERQRERRARERMARVALLLALTFLVATGAVGTYLITKRSGAQSEIAKAQQEITGLKAEKAEIDAIREEIKRSEPLVTLLNNARNSELVWCRMLRDVQTALPAGVQIDAVRSTAAMRPRVKEAGATGAIKGGPGVTITGAAHDQRLVGQFVANVRRQPSFAETYLNYSRAQRQGDVEVFQFEFAAMLASGAGGGSQ